MVCDCKKDEEINFWRRVNYKLFLQIDINMQVWNIHHFLKLY